MQISPNASLLNIWFLNFLQNLHFAVYWLFNFFFSRSSGIGNSFPCGPGHSSDEPGRTHPARHGGNVTGTSPPPGSLIHMHPPALFDFSLLLKSSQSSKKSLCSTCSLMLDVIFWSQSRAVLTFFCFCAHSTFRKSSHTSLTVDQIRSSRLHIKLNTMLRRWKSKHGHTTPPLYMNCSPMLHSQWYMRCLHKSTCWACSVKVFTHIIFCRHVAYDRS